MKITQEELNEKIRLHRLWLLGDKNGVKMEMSGSDLSGSDLSGSNLRGSNLSGSNLSYSNLRGSDLRYSNLSGSDLSGSNLSYSNLSGSDLSGSNLSYSNLRGSDLRYSNLSGSDLSGSNLRYSNLSGSDLSGSNLRGSMGAAYAQCSFDGHGECGRQLSLIIIAGEPVFFCGCFKGSPGALRAYIANGADEHKASRTLAMEFCLAAVAMTKQKKKG
jgi:uncharacterized protein YjbI with pentapeptide repeats